MGIGDELVSDDNAHQIFISQSNVRNFIIVDLYNGLKGEHIGGA